MPDVLSSAGSTHAPVAWPSVLILALMCTLIGIGGALIGESRWLVADDDNLWLAALVRANSSIELRRHEDQVIKSLRETGGPASDTTRFEKRREYGANYIGALQLWRFAADRLIVADKGDQGAPRALAKRMTFMFAFGIVAAWVLLGIVIARAANPVLIRAVLAALSVLVLWFVLVPIQFSQTLGLEKSVLHLAPEMLFTLLRPHDGLSVFGFTGRNLFAVVFLAVFLSRWSGHDRSAMLLFGLAASLHGSYASMMLPFVLLCDVLNRRKNLRDPLYLGLAALIAAYSIGSETLWRTVLKLDQWVLLALVLVLVGALLILLRQRFNTPDQNAPMRDITTLAGLWLLTLPIAVLMCQLADPLSVKYLWSQLHARSLGVLQPVFAVAFGLWLMQGGSFSRRGKALLFILAVGLPIGGLQGLGSSHGTVQRLTAEYERLTDRLAALPADSPWLAIREKSEEIAYFAIERALSGKPNALLRGSN